MRRRKKNEQPELEMVSMEAFGPCSLDYFMQQRVTSVREGGVHGAVWTIKFAGGGFIANFDPLIPMPKSIEGAAMTQQILGAHTDQATRTPVTEIRFGLESVKFNPLQFAMYEPNLTRGKLVFAQRSEANMPKLPPHPDERVAEGPTGPEEDDAEA